MSASPARRRGRPRGGRGGAEPRARIRQRETDVWALSMRGFTQREIARQVGITQAAVCHILRRLEERLAGELARNRVRHQARLLGRLEYVYRESVQGYERSQEDEVRKSQRRRLAAGAAAAQEVHELHVRKRSGDSRFLRVARDTAVAAAQWLPALPSAPPAPTPPLDLSHLTDAELDMVLRITERLETTPGGTRHPIPTATRPPGGPVPGRTRDRRAQPHVATPPHGTTATQASSVSSRDCDRDRACEDDG